MALSFARRMLIRAMALKRREKREKERDKRDKKVVEYSSSLSF
jgi:hypothetical protein